MAEPRYVLDHVGIGVDDVAAARRFYDAALAPLGFGVVFDWKGTVAYGLPDRPQFWVEPRDERYAPGPSHISFHATDRARVDAFHAAAVAAGGRDNGAPGLRRYHPNYYGAFVLDPDGNNVEAVCHTPDPG
jgi:catechol 2,3-dioxygenase-like lactoylglutathione lyase family enzyme